MVMACLCAYECVPYELFYCLQVLMKSIFKLDQKIRYVTSEQAYTEPAHPHIMPAHQHLLHANQAYFTSHFPKAEKLPQRSSFAIRTRQRTKSAGTRK